MKGYSLYPFLMDDIVRTSKKMDRKNGLKNTKKDRGHAPVVRDLFQKMPNMAQSMETVVMADEFYWLEHSDRHVIFPQNEDVIKKLLGAKIDLRNTAPIQMPHDTFVLGMPKGFKYKGFELPSVLINWCSPSTRDYIIQQFSKKYIGVQLEREKDKTQFENDFALMVNYRMPDEDLNQKMPEASGQLACMRSCAPQTLIPDMLRCEDGEDYKRVLGDFYCYDNAIPLNDYDHNVQYYIMKLVLMIAIYANSFPGALSSGYPGVPPKNLVPRLHQKWRNLSLGLPSDHIQQEEDKQYHYRSWHFRQLMHEKYYQGEHKDLPPGSRVVFVKDTMIGRKIEAETLT